MTDLEVAKQKLHSDACAFVLVKAGMVLQVGRRDGVGELLEALEVLGERARGAALADKIVGKAVAMMARLACLRAVYAPLMSQAACDALARAQIVFEYDRVVPLILNKRNDGLCPLERLTLPLDEPRAAVDALREFVRARA